MLANERPLHRRQEEGGGVRVLREKLPAEHPEMGQLKEEWRDYMDE